MDQPLSYFIFDRTSASTPTGRVQRNIEDVRNRKAFPVLPEKPELETESVSYEDIDDL